MGLLEIVLAKGAKGAKGSKDCLSGALRQGGGSDPGAWSARSAGEAGGGGASRGEEDLVCWGLFWQKGQKGVEGQSIASRGRCDGEAEVTRAPGQRGATVRRESFRGAELGEAIFCPFRRLRPFCQSRHWKSHANPFREASSVATQVNHQREASSDCHCTHALWICAAAPELPSGVLPPFCHSFPHRAAAFRATRGPRFGFSLDSRFHARLGHSFGEIRLFSRCDCFALHHVEEKCACPAYRQ